MIRLLLATASLAMMSCSPRPDAGKQTPQLHQVAYKAEDITTREGATRPFRTTSWRDGLRSRREAAYETATFVSIMDLEHGLQHKWEAADPSGTLEQSHFVGGLGAVKLSGGKVLEPPRRPASAS